MKMAKKGFSKDLLFLMLGLVIVLGILFYVLGSREGFYQSAAEYARAAAEDARAADEEARAAAEGARAAAADASDIK